jgi:hypothetical protein
MSAKENRMEPSSEPRDVRNQNMREQAEAQKAQDASGGSTGSDNAAKGGDTGNP